MGKKMFFRMKDVCLRPLRIISHSRTFDESEHKQKQVQNYKIFLSSFLYDQSLLVFHINLLAMLIEECETNKMPAYENGVDCVLTLYNNKYTAIM